MRILVSFLFAASLFAQHFPIANVQTLTEKKISLPADLPPGQSLLVIGFTQKSQTNSEAWSKQLKADLGKDFVFYSIAVLEDAPRLLRGIITGSIKKSVPKDDQDRFLIVTKGQKDLKIAFGFDKAAQDDAYLILTDKSGKMTWKYHGPPTRALTREIMVQSLERQLRP